MKINSEKGFDLDSWPRDVIQCHCTPFDHRHPVCEVWARLDQGEIIYMIRTRTFLIILLWPRNVVHGHCLLFTQRHSDVWEPDWAKGRENMSGQVISDGQTGRRTNRLITLGRPNNDSILKQTHWMSLA